LKLLVDADTWKIWGQNDTYILQFLPSCSKNVPAPLGTEPESGYIFRIRIWIFGKNRIRSGFSMYGMMYIECMWKHGRVGTEPDPVSESIFLTPPISDREWLQPSSFVQKTIEALLKLRFK